MDGKPIDDQLAIARLKEKRGDLNEANMSYRDIIKSNPGNAEALHRSAVSLTKQSNMDEAKKLFRKALEIDTPSAKLLNDYGYFCFINNDHREAEAYFRKAIDRQKDFLPAWTNLGLTLGEQGQFEESRNAFQSASPAASDVHCNMGYVYANQRMYELAQTEFGLALKENPNHAVAVEGLLQVSQKLPGKEPRTVLRTVASPNAHEEPPEKESSTDATTSLMPNSLPAVTTSTSPFSPAPFKLNSSQSHE
jgi:Tfp pilus assembly protein PilF